MEVAFPRLMVLNKGSLIKFRHNRSTFYAEVLELQPADAVHLIDVDLKVEFMAPLDFDPEKYDQKMQEQRRAAAAATAATQRQAAHPRAAGTGAVGTGRAGAAPPPGKAFCDNWCVL